MKTCKPLHISLIRAVDNSYHLVTFKESINAQCNLSPRLSVEMTLVLFLQETLATKATHGKLRELWLNTIKYARKQVFLHYLKMQILISKRRGSKRRNGYRHK